MSTRAFARAGAVAFSRLRAARGAFAGDEGGATAVEYGLIAGCVFLAIVSGVTAIGPRLAAIFTNAASHLK